MNIAKKQSHLVVGLSLSWLVTITGVHAASLIVNGDFENPVAGLAPQSSLQTNQSNLSPWETEATDGMIEMISSGYTPGTVTFDASIGTGVWDGGDQFVGLSSADDVLYQIFEVNTVGSLDLYFLHRGQGSATEQDFVEVAIWYYGWAFPVVAFTQTYGATNGVWSLQQTTGAWEVTPESLGAYAVTFTTTSSSGGGPSGNFIDNVNVGVNLAPVPEPSAALLVLMSGGCAALRRRRSHR